MTTVRALTRFTGRQFVWTDGREPLTPREGGIRVDPAAATPGDYDGAVSTSTSVFDGDGAAQLGRLAVRNLPGERRGLRGNESPRQRRSTPGFCDRELVVGRFEDRPPFPSTLGLIP